MSVCSVFSARRIGFEKKRVTKTAAVSVQDIAAVLLYCCVFSHTITQLFSKKALTYYTFRRMSGASDLY